MKNKYFCRIGSQDWVFSSEGRPAFCLYKIATTLIRRHVKIKGQANPFHPEWDHYFAERKTAVKIRRELDTRFGGTLGKQSVRGKKAAGFGGIQGFVTARARYGETRTPGSEGGMAQ